MPYEKREQIIRLRRGNGKSTTRLTLAIINNEFMIRGGFGDE